MIFLINYFFLNNFCYFLIISIFPLIISFIFFWGYVRIISEIFPEFFFFFHFLFLCKNSNKFPLRVFVQYFEIKCLLDNYLKYRQFVQIYANNVGMCLNNEHMNCNLHFLDASCVSTRLKRNFYFHLNFPYYT